MGNLTGKRRTLATLAVALITLAMVLWLVAPIGAAIAGSGANVGDAEPGDSSVASGHVEIDVSPGTHDDSSVRSSDGVEVPNDPALSPVDRAVSPADRAVSSVFTEGGSAGASFSSATSTYDGDDDGDGEGTDDTDLEAITVTGKQSSEQSSTSSVSTDDADLDRSASTNHAADLEDLEGSGTTDDPYTITTAEELQAIEQNLSAHYVLGATIDASNTSEWNWNETLEVYEGFDPIGEWDEDDPDPFTGTLDGDGHAIEQLHINRTNTPHDVGLFAYTEGSTIGNLSLVAVDVSGNNYVGSLVGDMDSGGPGSELSNVTVSGDVSGAGNVVGGLTGLAANSTIDDISVEVNVSGGDVVGGLAGATNEDAEVSTVDVTGTATGALNTGGVVGEHHGTATDSRGNLTVNGTEQVGGFVGGNFGTTTNSTADGTVSAVNEHVGGFAGGIGGDGEVTTSTSVAEVDPSAGVENVGGFVGVVEADAGVTKSTASGAVAGAHRVGGFAGRIDGQAADSTASGTVIGESTQIGGFVGYTLSATIERSFATGTVEGNENLVGGFVGRADGGTTIVASFASGNVSGHTDVGGFVGDTVSSSDFIPDPLISSSYATGEVEGDTDGERVGGFVGDVWDGSVDSSYSTGLVEGGDDVGGFAGRINDDVSGSYWDEATSNHTDGVGSGDDSGLTGLETESLTGTAAEGNTTLDFDTTWAVSNEYPILRWEIEEILVSFADPAITVGETTATTADASLVDDTAFEATDYASFESTDATVATVDGDGVVTGVRNGTTTIQATHGGVTGEERLIVGEYFAVTVEEANESVVEGETVEVAANVTNVGAEPGTQDVHLENFTGAVVDTVPAVELDPDESTTVNLTWVTASGDAGTGDVTVATDNETATRTVTVLEPAYFAVADLDAPTSANRTQTIEVSALLENEGEVAGEQTVELRLGEDVTGEAGSDYAVLNDAVVELDPAENETVELVGEVSRDATLGEGEIALVSANDSDSSTITIEAGTGTIAGTVEDAVTDDGLENVTIVAENETGETWEIVTDADGSYAVDVPVGEYDVSALAPVHGNETETDVAVDHEETTVQDFALDPDPATIEGTVVDSYDESGVDESTVTVLDDAEEVVNQTTTGADGAFSFANVSPHEAYTVEATAPDFQNGSVATDVLDPAEIFETTVALDAENGSIAGTVVDEDGVSLEDVEITAEALDPDSVSEFETDGGGTADDGPVYVTETDADGDFEFPDVERANYSVTAVKDGYGTNATLVSVGPNETVEAVDFTLDSEVGEINGTVIANDTDDPLEDIDVVVIDDEEQDVGEDSTDADGFYEIDDLDAGNYTVTFVDPGGAYESFEQSIDLGPGENATVDANLDPQNATIGGAVTDAVLGDGIEGATVVVAGGETIEETDVTNESGNYAVEVPVGNYSIEANATNYSPSVTNVTVERGENATVDLELEPDPATLAGVVFDNVTGATVSGATVELENATGESWTDDTDGDGQYEIDALDPGEYTLTVEHEDYRTNESTVSLDAGENRTVTVTLDVGTLFAVDSLAVDPETAEPGENVTVNTTVRNVGDATGTQTVWINSTFEGIDNETLPTTLAPGENRTVEKTYNTTGQAADTYTITVSSANETETGTVELETADAPPPPPPPDADHLTVSAVEASPALVTLGETVAVSATVENPTEENLTESLTFTADGEVVDEEVLTVQAGESGDVSFEWHTATVQPGNYTLTVAGAEDEGSATVTVVDGEPEFVVDIVDVSENVVAGDAIAVTAEVENRGEVPDEQVVEFEIDGQVETTEALALGPDEYETVTASLETTEAHVGTVTVSVGTEDDLDSTTVDVRSSSDEDDDSPVTPPPTEDDDADDDPDEDVEDENITDDSPDDGLTAEENVTGVQDTLSPVNVLNRELITEGVDYEPSPEAQHVGTFAWLAALLAGLAALVFVTVPTVQGRLLGATLGTASLRATVDVLHVVVEDLAGALEHLAAANVALEVTVALTFLRFAAEFAGETRLTDRRGTAATFGVGALVVLAVASNPIHGAVFTAVTPVDEPFGHLATTLGPAGWAILALTASLMLAGAGLILQSFLQAENPAWRPVAVVSTGICLAVIVGAMNVLERGPLPQYDYNAAAVGALMLLTAVPLLGHGLQRVSTVARETILEEMDDPIVILDDAREVVDYNASAAALFPGIESGLAFDDLLSADLSYPDPDETVSVELAAGDLVDREWSPGGNRSGGPAGVDDVTRKSAGVDDVARKSAVEADDAAQEPAIEGNDGDRDDTAVVDDPVDVAVPTPETYYLVQVSPVTTQTREGIGYSVRFADVTEIRRQTDELREKNEKLDQFASTVSHDLRNPLNVAEGYVDLIEDDIDAVESAIDDDPVAEQSAKPESDSRALDTAVAEIDRSLSHMGKIVDDILTLARCGDPVTDFRTVPFSEEAEEAWADAQTAEASLVVDRDGTIEADPSRLQRLLGCLYRNAVEHGRPDATVTVELTEDGFAIADDGPGVPDTVGDRIFEHGYSTDGTGIGLTIVTEIATAHGWSVHLDESHDGARFVVTGAETALRVGDETEVRD